MSASPCRTQVQPVTSFLVYSLIFIEYKLNVINSIFTDFQYIFQKHKAKNCLNPNILLLLYKNVRK